jgi:tetratricopeptide (TPR) repeat protein
MKKITVVIILLSFCFIISCEDYYEYKLEKMSKEIFELISQRNYEEALKRADDACNYSKSHFGRNHEFTSVSLRNIAKVYMKLGQFEKAKPLILEAIEIEKQFGNMHRGLAHALGDLSSVNEHQKQYRDAINTRLQSIVIFEELYGKDDEIFVEPSLRILANLYKITGEAEKAAKIYNRLGRNTRGT